MSSKENQKNAMMAEVTAQFEDWYHRYEPKDWDDVRQECVLEILWFCTTSALLLRDYEPSAIQKDFDNLVKMHQDAQDKDS
jgi:hypothetical protein